MTQVTGNVPDGTPNWLDIGVPDLDRAKTFYGTLLGWQFQDTGPEGGHYNMCMLRGEPVAGMMQNPGDQPDEYWWSVYFAAADCDRVIDRATGAGGEVVVPPMDVMDQGRLAILKDPQGGQFGLWQGGAHPGSRIVNAPGSFVWNELATPDSAAAGEFYRAVFGYETEPMPGDMDYLVLRRAGDGRYIGGILGGSGVVVGGGSAEVPSWTTYFAVDDADAAVRKVRAGGGTVDSEPADSPYGRSAAVRDPFRVPLRVMKPAPEPAP
ncbi:VOC family protein [Actinomadura sp. BRA 177]|uniref:VOC family protein n=1 Tax=Actinomadura sp. BRA 177 TaxID=2745202 RepID=UPI0015963886|nr:VOC family protein [Actinomadura sp. BRA 177]NVI92585.1 VOC family protein [Actinomadura sp. BRA 177]